MYQKRRRNNTDSFGHNIGKIVLAVAAAVLIIGCSTLAQSSSAPEGTTASAASAGTTEEGQVSGDAQTAAAAEVSGEPLTEESDTSSSLTEETVTVMIPTVYENVTTQEEADEIREKNGYESATLEEDGSLTIVMSKSQHEEMLRQFRESVDRGISEIIDPDAGSSIEEIEYNDDYSVFTVTVNAEEIGIIERQAAEELIMYGTLYHIYTGNDADHIQVDYVSRESGEVIGSADSGSLGNAY